MLKNNKKNFQKIQLMNIINDDNIKTPKKCNTILEIHRKV